MKDKYIKKALQTILGLLIAVLLFEAAVYTYPPLLVLGYAVFGRSSCCSMREAFRGAQNSLRQREAIRANLSKSNAFKLLEEDSLGFHKWKTPQGNYWISGSSDQILPILLGQQESNIYGIGTQAVQKGDIVLDCGAHVGVFARKALALGAQKVIAIEPAAENLECLRRNLEDEILRGSVIVYPKGVWDEESNINFQKVPDNSAADHFLANDNNPVGQVQTLPVTTIDKLVAELGLKRVDFIKMDIKGATERALRGAQQTLSSSVPKLAISTEEKDDDAAHIIELTQRLQPKYKTECGYCAIVDNRVYPMVVFFHQ